MYKKILFLIITTIFICTNTGYAEHFENSYIHWLQKHSAWQILNNKLERLSPTPENIITRADFLYRMQKPEKSLTLLETHGKFSKDLWEANRLWLIAKIHRTNMQHFLALENYSRAGSLISLEDFRQKVENKPDVKWYWKTVWKKWFWKSCSGEPCSKNLSKKLLNVSRTAKRLWPQEHFWQYLQSRTVDDFQYLENTSSRKNSRDSINIRSPAREKIVQALLAACMGNMNESRKRLHSIANKKIRFLWRGIFSGIFKQNFEPQIDKTNAYSRSLKRKYPKYKAFQSYILPLLENQPSGLWLVQQPRNSSWINFRVHIYSLDSPKALKNIQNELDSALLKTSTQVALKKYAFIYAVLNKDYQLARRKWKQLQDPCLSLRLAGRILGLNSSCREINSNKIQHPYFKQFYIILQNTLGNSSVFNLQAPFWIKASRINHFKISSEYPLDLLLNYNLHRKKWSKNPSAQMAKTVSLLYPMSLLKNRACMWLAKKAHNKENPDKAWGYLGEITPDQDFVPDKMRRKYLKARAGLLMEKGKKERSLQTYRKLLDMDQNNISAEKKLNLAMLSQELGQWEWAQKTLRDLWEKKQELPSDSRAEVLFWLGEGAQNKGLSERAKDYYFRLAWKYPKKHMWTLTALHRAALICKKQGQLLTAKKVLERVIKESEQKSQKKQAQKILSGIEKQITKGQASNLLY